MHGVGIMMEDLDLVCLMSINRLDLLMGPLIDPEISLNIRRKTGGSRPVVGPGTFHQPESHF